MKYGSVCSGIEAATVAWETLGWEPAWLAEIDTFPSKVLAHHYPTVNNLGDMNNIPFLLETGLIDAPDVLVGGTPCQSFSLAGLRKGLSDERGSLTLKYVEILNKIDEVRGEPCIAVWENVPGVLSSKDNAFGCFLAGLAGEDRELQPPGGRWANAGYVSGPKRTVAWRVLDAQYFRVAQRRRRVFVVASAGAICPSQILFEREGVRRDFAPMRTQGKEVAGDAEGSLGSGCWWDGGQISQTLDAGALAAQPGMKQQTYVAFPANLSSTQYASTENLSPSLGATNPTAIAGKYMVRRFTPKECERLQGFPDDYTLIPGASDSARYKALGNSMAVPVMRFIGQRIQQKVDIV